MLPWTILRVEEQDHTVSDFFTRNVMPRLSHGSRSHCAISSAHVGRDKASLDLVDVSLPLVAVVTSFGPFLKYNVSLNDVTETATIELDESQTNCPLVFVEPVRERTKKDKLFNDIVSYFVSASVSLESSELSMGRRLVIVLRDILWHIDGHHHVFQQRAQPIPSSFHSFINYNNPQLSKHRKRLTSNMSSNALRDFALELSTILHFSFWDRPHWLELKPIFLSLLQSISSYVEYLITKNKKVKRDHRSPTPVRELSTNMYLKYIASTNSETLASLVGIERKVENCDFYELNFISELLPSDRTQKHRVVESLVSNGLQFNCILLVYTPGSNIGNLHFLWKVPSSAEVAECFECSQSSIEEAKKRIPIYHTRAMRTAMYKKFGLVSSTVKPAVLRFFYKDLTGKTLN